MPKEFLLIDGYNIIHSWEPLKELLSVSLESARQKLMDMVSNYQGYKGITVILVFDGHLVKGNIGTVMQYHNIHVVFTKEAETADHYIERVVNNLPKRYRVRVATSDALEQMIILGQGATRVSAREFLMEIESTEKSIRENYIANKPPKNNLLADNIDKDALAWIEELRRKK